MDEGERKDRKRKEGGMDAENGHVAFILFPFHCCFTLNVMLLAGMEAKNISKRLDQPN